MSAEQALFIFNTLPVDITFVDENDKVRFFNRAKERLFPRSPAIVGRAVQNCHPPESVHLVEKIIESFRLGKKDRADFWIQMKGMFILIQYYAIRNEEGEYKGVLEVSQDVTDIRRLEGQKRLPDWE
jgi:PAS domain S-box-containing protein